jgi:hypothetical protein
MLAATGSAADLTIAISAVVTSLDPHCVAVEPNSTIGWHVFDALTRVDERARLIPERLRDHGIGTDQPLHQ